MSIGRAESTGPLARRGLLGLALALVCGIARAGLPPSETLFDKVVEVGRALGFHEAYEDRAEGLFIWRIVTRDPGGTESCNGFFEWYLKPGADKVALVNGVVLIGCINAPWVQAEQERLLDDFKRRWFAMVGPVTIIPEPTTHTFGLGGAVINMLRRESGDRVNREPPQPAPAGFAWRRLAEINGFVLMPQGWFVKREINRRTSPVIAYFVSQEDIDTAGSFQTGLSLNVLMPSQSEDAEAHAKAVVAGIVRRPDLRVLRAAWDTLVGRFHHYGCVVGMPSKDGPLVVEQRLIVNTITKTTYNVIFESPERDWKNASEKGAKLFELLSLDETI
jgi:hypothetical protein